MSADGFDVKLHKSLTEPILIAGVPRKLALMNGTLTAAFALGAQSLIAIPIGIAFHIVFAVVTLIEPCFFEALIRHMKRSDRWL